MDGEGQKQRMDQIQDLGMSLWEEWEDQHRKGRMQADLLSQAGGQRGRRMGLFKDPVARTAVCTCNIRPGELKPGEVQEALSSSLILFLRMASKITSEGVLPR